MAAITVETKVDESKAGAIPELRPLLGQDIVLVAVPTRPDAKPLRDDRAKITLDDFLRDHQLRRPEGVGPVSLKDMERAIARGAVGGDV